MARGIGFLAIACLGALVFSPTNAIAQWVENGVPVFTAPGLQAVPVITSDGSGGIIIAWCDIIDYYGDWDIYAQRVDSAGVLRWAGGGVYIRSCEYRIREQQIVTDGDGGAIIIWEDYGGGDTVSVYAQRINASGILQWVAGGIHISRGLNFVSIPDDAGGAIIAVCRKTTAGSDVYAQRVDASGVLVWGTGGVAVCTADSNQANLCITADGSGGAVVAWTDPRNGTDTHIYAQRIDASGAVQWDVDGVVICESDYQTQTPPDIVSDGGGGAIITWMDIRGLSNADVYAQKINGSGAVQWTIDGVVICAAAGDERHPRALSDGGGGAIITWKDDRDGSDDIYAQRVNSSGSVQWAEDGEAVCTAAGNQIGPCIISDGGGGAIIGWCDPRNGSDYDIYAQRLNAAGTPQWTDQGVAICDETGDQLYCVVDQIVSTGTGGAIFAWQDERSGDHDIYAQVVSANGNPGEHFVATALYSYTALVQGRAVGVRWILSEVGEDPSFSVFRSRCESDYLPIDPVIEQDGSSFSFIDVMVEPGTGYRYRIDVSDEAGTRTLFVTDRVVIPAAGLALDQNIPNPFNPSTRIHYYIPERCYVKLEIFDVSGRLVAGLVDGFQESGQRSVAWNGIDDSGKPVGSGIYFYRLRSGKEEISRKMVLLR